MFKKLFRLSFWVFIILFIVLFFWWQWAINPVDSQADSRQVFVVPQGQPASVISQRLKDQGYIKSQLAFNLLINRKGLSHQLQAGDFYLSQSMKLTAILESLTRGSLDYWFTIPEGWRTEEISQALAKKSGLMPQEFILAAKPLEGKLFPDTYLIPQQASATDIIKLLTDNFEAKFASLEPQFNRTNFTKDKVIIIASLIEREARHQQDRPLVSSVIHNRLNLGMALQIDATVQYILGNNSTWWPKTLTKKDLQTLSPYNTYLHSGLPPAPIANPGLAALKAAVNPSNTDYLYYVSDSAGYNHYAKDLAGHQQNIEKYLD